jgi:hypothetical protein
MMEIMDLESQHSKGTKYLEKFFSHPQEQWVSKSGPWISTLYLT